MPKEKITEILPTVNLSGLVVFPKMTFSFELTHKPSVQIIKNALEYGSEIFLSADKKPGDDPVTKGRLFPIGTVCRVRQVLTTGRGSVRALLAGQKRAKIENIVADKPILLTEVQKLEEPASSDHSSQTKALMRTCIELLRQFTLLSHYPLDLLPEAMDISSPGQLADYIAQNIIYETEGREKALQERYPLKRLQFVIDYMRKEAQIADYESTLSAKVREKIFDDQKNMILQEQMRVIKEELGEDNEPDEIDKYERKIAALKADGEVRDKFSSELRHLKNCPPMSSDAELIKAYLDYCLGLPWGKKTKDDIDLERTRKVLDRSHYGLTDVKERIVEYMAVKKLSPELRGQIICFIGPPGVGKTTIALSVAKAMKRKFARISLGGIHDEAEIRGHRKTYIGAMAGRILSSVRTAGSMNPVIVLDEIDKLGSSANQGDPASALLEVLDPDLNSTFRDNYAEVPFDLSDVFFILTANSAETIPAALSDRMEIIEVPSYTDEEKLCIAKSHLLPKQRKQHGLSAAQLHISDAAMHCIIDGYTKEAGVRKLERELARICRKTAVRILDGEFTKADVRENNLSDFLGPRKYHIQAEKHADSVGVVNGMAWTGVGGELLEIEANVFPGTGKLILTGNLGDVMQESCKTALGYLRSTTDKLGISSNFYKTKDIQIHFPDGATPKDGPSAGIAVFTALVSALTGSPVRGDIAMTGEITLQGRVSAIGGLREKTMGALREGIRTILLPEDNVPDLSEIDPLVREKLKFIPVRNATAVLSEALCGKA